MAKKSGSKSSRSERRAGRKRAESAREHGLPTRQEPPPRARAITPEPSDDGYGEARSSDSPLSRAKPAGIPTLVKVIGGALVILTGVYLLSRQRESALSESKPAAEPAAAVSASALSAPEVAPEPLPAPSAAAAPAPELAPAPEPASAPAAVVSVTPPVKPVVAAPVVAAPSKPKVAPVAAPVAPAAPQAVAPKPPAAPKPPVDNPY